MGYANYWEMPVSTTPGWPQAYVMVSRFAATIFEITNVELGDWKGEADGPEISERRIAFNGLGDGSCETFAIPSHPEDESYVTVREGLVFGFCKTRREPYDEVVKALVLALLVACEVNGCPIDIGCDDGDEAMEEGFALYQTAAHLLGNPDERSFEEILALQREVDELSES